MAIMADKGNRGQEGTIESPANMGDKGLWHKGNDKSDKGKESTIESPGNVGDKGNWVKGNKK